MLGCTVVTTVFEDCRLDDCSRSLHMYAKEICEESLYCINKNKSDAVVVKNYFRDFLQYVRERLICCAKQGIKAYKAISGY